MNLNKFAIGVSSDGMEFGMTHGPFDFEELALSVDPPYITPQHRQEAEAIGSKFYVVGFRFEGFKKDHSTHQLLWIWDYEEDEWVRLFPRVVHCKKEVEGTFTYIGRGSKWGNPFVIGKDGDREEVIMKYADWLMTQDHLLTSLPELRHQNLGCYCAPQSCHGDILLELANVKPGDPWPPTNSVFTKAELDSMPWVFTNYVPDDTDFAIRAHEFERFNRLTSDGIAADEPSHFMAGFIRGLAWGIHKTAKQYEEGGKQDDLPF